jgi:tetratricopeptide (TPR) repeat protein
LLETQPNAPWLDRVLFEIALAHQESGQGDDARRAFRTLIQRFPQSPLAAPSWLAFGDFYFESGDMDSARQFYERMVATFDPSNEVYGYALYRLAWSFQATEGVAAVRRRLIEVSASLRARGAGPLGSRVLTAVRAEVARRFLDGRGAPPDDAALRELEREVGDDAPAVLTSVADAARVAGAWATARAVLTDLLAAHRDSPLACGWMGSRDALSRCDPSEPSRYGAVTCSP